MKLDHLKQSNDLYEIDDPKTGAQFKIQTTENHKGIKYHISTYGSFSSAGLQECMSLLKELVAADCYSSIVQDGEKHGRKKIKVLKNVGFSLTDLMEKQQASLIPKK